MNDLNKLKIILVHGKDADPGQKWYPWLKKEVEKNYNNNTFLAPKLPKADDPVLDEWLREIENLIRVN